MKSYRRNGHHTSPRRCFSLWCSYLMRIALWPAAAHYASKQCFGFWSIFGMALGWGEIQLAAFLACPRRHVWHTNRLWNSWERIESPLAQTFQMAFATRICCSTSTYWRTGNIGFQMQLVEGHGATIKIHQVKPTKTFQSTVFFSLSNGLYHILGCLVLARCLQDPCPGYFESGAQDTTLRVTRQGVVRIDTWDRYI